MKIGILTFSAALNHGAQLQAFALRMALLKMNHEVEIINYSPRYLTAPYGYFYRLKGKRSILSTCKQLIATFLDTPQYIQRTRKMNEFHAKYFSLSKSIHSSKELSNTYDCIVVGSDQVWNPEFNHGFDEMFFLKGTICKHKISYAASFTLNTLKEGELKELASQIQLFEKISVREDNLRAALQPYIPLNIETVVDPTFLLTKEQWKEFLPKEEFKNTFISIFQARGNSCICENVAKKIQSKTNSEIIVNLSCSDHSLINRKKNNISPLDFVNYIAHSDYVVALSFHGVALSIIMERPFYYVYLNDGRNGRIESILSELGLCNRIIQESDNIDVTPIDYSSIRPAVEKLRSKGLQYLSSISSMHK